MLLFFAILRFFIFLSPFLNYASFIDDKYALFLCVPAVVPVWPAPFCNCNKSEGFFNFNIALMSFNLFCMICDFAFNKEYLNPMLCLITSSEEAMNSKDNNSRNLYSMFWMKSSLARPSFLHEEHCKVIVRFFLAAVEHFNDEAEEAWELYVEFLVVSDFFGRWNHQQCRCNGKRGRFQR